MEVGIDILEIDRFLEIEKEETKLKKMFTAKEIEYFNKFQFKTSHIAGTFCAKEAFVKALKTGFTKEIGLLDVEILHNENGVPYINLNNENICIGVSTGVDSTVLLDCLLKLKTEVNFNIILCHVNHQKREQSKIEEKYITNFATEKDLIIEVLHLNLEEIEEENFQSSARFKRLEFFNSIMNKYNCK